jgi:hypothetical protein
MVAFFWVGTPQKGMEIIKSGLAEMEGIDDLVSRIETMGP